MQDYDFSTLNDKEFEQLCRDLLNAKLDLNLQSFKVGKDKGVDLRYSTQSKNNSIVVQAKHYAGSKYAQLKHTLKSKELKKVQDLKPDRYIVATSLPLSAAEKDEIKDIFAPFISTSNDVIGKEDLNTYLSEFEKVEAKYFKLWFSSVTVLRQVFNNAIEGRSLAMLESIKRKISYYVITEKFNEANVILNKERLLLISGQPGIGKTTLAEALVIDKAREGYKFYKIENIREAEDVFSSDENELQLFYFDDFLGSNYLEIINSQRSESQLTTFIERIRFSSNKFLILTTRTIILNQAVEQHEKIARSSIKGERFEIKLDDYSNYEKAQILYNHLYFRNLRPELISVIIERQFYRRIINHPNYTPRIIEFITESRKISELQAREYLHFITANLNNPKEIWRYTFTNQVGYDEQCLLLTLFTFGNCSEKTLRKSFNRRLQYEKKEHNRVINSNQFIKSINVLLDGFISSTLIVKEATHRFFEFINPSLNDFFIGYLNESYQEKRNIILSIVFFEQFKIFNSNIKLIEIEIDLQNLIVEKVVRNEITFLRDDFITDYARQVQTFEFLCTYCRDVNKDSAFVKVIDPLDFKNYTFGLSGMWFSILSNIENSPVSFSYIKNNFVELVEKIIESIFRKDRLKKIPILFKKFDHDYDVYIKSEDAQDRIREAIQDLLNDEWESVTSEHDDSILELSTIDHALEEVCSLGFDLEKELSVDCREYELEIDYSYWEERIVENEKRNNYEEERAMEWYEGENYRPVPVPKDENSKIDDLFIRPN